MELVTKEADFDRARKQNYRRAEELAEKGKQFRNVLDWELCWYFETRHFLKGGSRVIAMADYKAEKALVLAVPHRFLIGEPEQIAPPTTTRPAPRQRRLPLPGLRLDSGARATVHSERTTAASP